MVDIVHGFGNLVFAKEDVELVELNRLRAFHGPIEVFEVELDGVGFERWRGHLDVKDWLQRRAVWRERCWEAGSGVGLTEESRGDFRILSRSAFLRLLNGDKDFAHGDVVARCGLHRGAGGALALDLLASPPLL
jgi:hypothetical protein